LGWSLKVDLIRAHLVEQPAEILTYPVNSGPRRRQTRKRRAALVGLVDMALVLPPTLEHLAVSSSSRTEAKRAVKTGVKQRHAEYTD
jgi:hypothetical protein